MTNPIAEALAECEALARATREATLPAALQAGEAIAGALLSGRRLLVCGNGGSASDAEHFACEIAGQFVAKGRRALPALALTANSSSLTAIANDFGYEFAWSRQVEAYGQRGDVLVGITTSGRSPNVLAALQRAQQLGLRTIALVGAHTAQVEAIADFVVSVPHRHTPRIQEMHIAIIHAWCQMVDDATIAGETRS